MTDISRIELGKLGEDLACRELLRRGYAILARGYRTRAGEIDVVAEQGDTLVFIEVKTRVGSEFGCAAEAVTPWKQRRLVRMAEHYLFSADAHHRPCRFDVVAIDFLGGDPVITVYESAFVASR